MSRRATTLSNTVSTTLTREIESKYDVIKLVSEHVDAIETLANEDIAALAALLQEATDFEGITVVSGAVASWDPETKVLIVPTVKGDKGDTGEIGPQGEVGPQGPQGIQGPQGETGKSAYELAVENGFEGTYVDWAQTIKGMDGFNGATPIYEFSYNEVTGDLEYEVVGYDTEITSTKISEMLDDYYATSQKEW